MNQHSPDLHFGIEVAGQRSRWWRVRSGARRPELFLERESVTQAHISLHESGQWHLKVDKKQRVLWNRPSEIAIGFTRALLIIQPGAVATITLPDTHDVKRINITERAHPVHFNVFIEKPEINLSSWPGRTSMGTVLIGRIPLANDAGWCSVVAHQEPFTLAPQLGPKPTEEVVNQMREAAEDGSLYATLVSELADGTMAFVDGRVSTVSETK
ncbi:hypothetical protein ABZ860_26970 [Microbispora sp. NPDC046973]|uniref:hypothetical protein n=1 Tax=Microbispora sp. NPDC046973 TaxID=3155022 RepID=UPI0033E8341A